MFLNFSDNFSVILCEKLSVLILFFVQINTFLNNTVLMFLLTHSFEMTYGTSTNQIHIKALI